MSKTFSEQLKEAIEASGHSNFNLAFQSGVSESTLSRFLNGRNGLNSDSIDKLVETLEIKVTFGKSHIPRGRQPGRPKTK